MSNPNQYVARQSRTATWNLVRGADTIASAHALSRPDGRWFVSVDAWDDAAWAPLTTAMIRDLGRDLHAIVDEGDEVTLDCWRRLGFEVVRRELNFVVPVDPVATGLADARPPNGLVFLSADAVDETELRKLDDTLRAEVTGTDDWINDPQEFHDYTFAEQLFDPATYLVAVDDAREAFAGLVRVVVPGRPRLGLIAVTSAYRRRGLARGLLAAAFAPLHERGIAHVAAEADANNTAAIELLEQIGSQRTGASIELIHRAGT
jgi:ribosomal protein S18 acetylase RimI-like enzyme